MNFNPICVYDYETGSPDASNCQIIQIGAMMIHSRRLEIMDSFSSWICPDFEAEGCTEDTLKWHANNAGKSYDEFVDFLKEQPSIEVVWKKFTNWVDSFNGGKPKPSAYKAPIPAGYNIINFDNPISDRYCLEYGPTDKDKRLKKKTPRLFNGVYKFDLIDHIWYWFENIDVGPQGEIANLKLETVMEHMGFPKEDLENTHDALTDVKAAAKIIIRLLNTSRWMREYNEEKGKRRLEFANAFGG